MRYERASRLLKRDGVLAIVATQHVLPDDGDSIFTDLQKDYPGLMPGASSARRAIGFQRIARIWWAVGWPRARLLAILSRWILRSVDQLAGDDEAVAEVDLVEFEEIGVSLVPSAGGEVGCEAIEAGAERAFRCARGR